MLFLIEGLDRTGKTTLAARLSDQLGGAPVVHFSAPKASKPIVEYLSALVPYRGAEDEHVIYDRGHIGEVVWPKFFGRESIVDEAAWRYIEMFYTSRGALYLYCRRDPDELKLALLRDEEPLSPDDVDAALEAYEGALAQTANPFVRYDHGDPVEPILEVADRTAQFARPGLDVARGAWIGSPRPHTLYVLDRDVDDPAGPQFQAAMADAGEDWRAVACTTVRNVELRDLWNYLGRPQIAALTQDVRTQIVNGPWLTLPGTHDVSVVSAS